MNAQDPDFRLLFEHLPLPCLAVRADLPRYTVIAASRAYLQWSQQSLETVMGAGVGELYERVPQLLGRGAAPQLYRSLMRVLTKRALDVMAPAYAAEVGLSASTPAATGGQTGEPPSELIAINLPVFAQDGGIACLLHLLSEKQWLLHRGISAGRLQPAGRDPRLDFRRELRNEAGREAGQDPRTQAHRLGAAIVAAEARERRDEARLLHDDLSQVLAAAHIRLASLCEDTRLDVRSAAQSVAALLERAQASARSQAARLSPAILHELGLMAALEWMAEDVMVEHGIAIQLQDDGQAKPLAETAKSVIYRTLQGLLLHLAEQGAQCASVALRTLPGGVFITLTHDARHALDAGRMPAAMILWLDSTCSRIAVLNGTFIHKRFAPSGGQVEMSLPFDPDQVVGELPVSR